MNAFYKQVTKGRYIRQVSELAAEIFPEHYHRMTLPVARALAQGYQSEDRTDDEIHDNVNYFLIYLGTEAVGYFALDLRTPGELCISRLFVLQKARRRGIGRDIIAYAAKLAQGDVRGRMSLTFWAKDLETAAFCKKNGFRPAGTLPREVLPGVTLDLATWERLRR
jgi:GNAT superfamily N-acetyltransferase